VPPLAAPSLCFDLRRGHSMAEHLSSQGHSTHLVEYGAISFSDRDLGLEHWVEDVIPTAVRAVSEEHDGAPVQLVGWCLGGIMSVLSAPATRTCRSTASPASPARSTSPACGSWRRSGRWPT
jgi:polyhydroxyalkanoate synthase